MTPTPITSISDILNTDRDKTLDELIEEAWLEQLLAIAHRADEIERAAQSAAVAA